MPDHPLFARFYDRLTARTERAGLADMRHRLLSSASGRVLELGAGTGHNLEHYTDAVTELVLAEPDPNMAKLLRERLDREGTAAGHASVIEVPAEELPFDDGSFDVVVATLVLCTVEDPGRALAEARRVLVEGGRFLYLEHVRSATAGARPLAELAREALGMGVRRLPSEPRDGPVARRCRLLDRQPRARQAPQGAPAGSPRDPGRGDQAERGQRGLSQV